ncbi:hypothetical protein BH09ACT12_BH09ACT12_23290 [soil metagenome]
MPARVRRVLLLTFALLLFAVGALWTFQGLGYIGGSEMTDVEIWAVIGPLVAGLGVALGVVSFRRGG